MRGPGIRKIWLAGYSLVSENRHKHGFAPWAYPIETSVRKLLAASKPPTIMPAHTPITIKQRAKA